MHTKALAIATVVTLALGIFTTSYLFWPTQAESLGIETRCGGTVDRRPKEQFQVEVTFKNKGTVEGTWQVTVAFEGDDWNWAGEQRRLILESNEKEVLTWEGTVPEDAVVDSVARLIVYFDNEFVALNWWIHIVSGAELAVVGSQVR